MSIIWFKCKGNHVCICMWKGHMYVMVCIWRSEHNLGCWPSSSSCVRQDVLWVTVSSFWLSPFLACPLAVGMIKLLASFTKSRFYWVLGIWIHFSILVLQTFFQLSHCLNLFVSILSFKNTYHEYIHMYTFNCFTC